MRNNKVKILRKIILFTCIAILTTGCAGKEYDEKTEVLGEEIVEEKPEESKLPEKEISDKDTESTNLEEADEHGVDIVDEAYFKDYLIQNTDCRAEDILFEDVSDYDRDGRTESFIFVGAFDDEFGTYSGNMWFTDGNRCIKLVDSSTEEWWGMHVINIEDGRRYVYADEYYATGARSIVWSVYDGEPKECEISGLGSVEQDDDGQITIIDSNYDAVYDKENDFMLGHTWKPYYFYYDSKEDQIKEYGTKVIDKQEIDSYCGFDLMEQIEASGKEITSVFYRDNGVMNINYLIDSDDSFEIRYGNVNYDCNAKCYIKAWDKDKNDMDNSDFGGIYLEIF